MFWAGIANEIVGPFRVAKGVELSSHAYTEFLNNNFLPWYKSKKLSFRKSFVFMQDNAPSHATRLTSSY